MPEFQKLIFDSIDYYQNLSSRESDDYLSNEDLDIKSKHKLCPEKSDFGPNKTHYKYVDYNEIGYYYSVGLFCYNYTTKKTYLE